MKKFESWQLTDQLNNLVLLNGIQQAINELFDSAESAENSNEVENYLRVAKPLTNALLAIARMELGE